MDKRMKFRVASLPESVIAIREGILFVRATFLAGLAKRGKRERERDREREGG